MADPVPYERDFSFTGFQSANPSTPLPGSSVDTELDNVQTSIEETIEALADIRRSDGALVNGIVTTESLNPAVTAYLVALQVAAAASAAAAAGSAATAVAGANAAAASAVTANAARILAEAARDVTITARDTALLLIQNEAAAGVSSINSARSAAIAAVNIAAANSIGTIQALVSSAVAASNVPIIGSATALAGLTIPAGLQSLYLQGLSAPDGVGGQHVARVDVAPVDGIYYRSLDRFTKSGGVTPDAVNGGYHVLNEPFIDVEMAGADPTGTVPANVAFRKALAYAKLRGWGVRALGKYLFDCNDSVNLDVAKFNHGDIALKACLLWPYGVRLVTAGTRTEFRIQNITATACFMAIDEEVGTHSQDAHEMDIFKLVTLDGIGRYGVVTPRRSGLIADKRPRYNKLHAHFCSVNIAQTITPYGWDVGLMVGDMVGGDIYFEGYGTYNVTGADAGQHNMVGCKVSAVNGAYGFKVRFQAANMRTFFEAGDGVEGCDIDGYEGLGCWYGIYFSGGLRPGGFIGSGHINTGRTGLYLKNRASIQIGRVEVYRSDGFHAHTGEWSGIELEGCIRATIGSLHAIHGSTHTKTLATAVKATSSTFHLLSYDAIALASVAKVIDCPDCQVESGVVNAVDYIFDLQGAATQDFRGGNVMGRSGPLTAYLKTDGTVDKKRIRFPQETSIQLRNYEVLSISAAGTHTVNKRFTASRLQVNPSAGAGAYTYDIVLDPAVAVGGDMVEVKIIGVSSANPTIRVLDDIGGTVLSSFNNLGGTVRKNATYVFYGDTSAWVEWSVTDSQELTY